MAIYHYEVKMTIAVSTGVCDGEPEMIPGQLEDAFRYIEEIEAGLLTINEIHIQHTETETLTLRRG